MIVSVIVRGKKCLYNMCLILNCYRDRVKESKNTKPLLILIKEENFFDVLLTVHLSIFILVINQLDAQNFCFAISLFHVSTCFEHMCSKRVEA